MGRFDDRLVAAGDGVDLHAALRDGTPEQVAAFCPNREKATEVALRKADGAGVDAVFDTLK